MTNRSASRTGKRSTIGNDPTRAAGLMAGGLVALVAAVASYSHQRQLASHHGEQWLSYLLPLSVDGLLVVASLVIVTARRHETRAPFLAWLALVVGVLVSLAANIAAAGPDLGSRIIAAWPPLAFAGAFELVLRLTKATRGRAVAGVVVEVAEPVDELDDDALKTAIEDVYQQEPDISERRLAERLEVKRHRVQKAIRAIRDERRSQIRAVGGQQ